MWKIIKQIGTTLVVTILGMRGGQKTKGIRRFGIPGFSFVTSLFDGFQWRDISFLLLIPILAMGYGENSFLMGLVGSDFLVRILYAFILSLPFYIYGLKRGLVASVLLTGAFLVRAGSYGSLPWIGEVLIEDVCRYGVLGSLISFNLFVKRK